MDLNTVARAALLNFVINFILILILIQNQFFIGYQLFAVFIVVSMLFCAFYAGRRVKKYPEIHGMLVGILSLTAILSYLSKNHHLNWNTNLYLLLLSMFFGLIGAWIGHKTNKNKEINELELNLIKK